MSDAVTIELPKQKLPPTSLVPESAIWFGLPKCGKTTAISELPNCLIIDVEKGANKIDAMRIQPPKDAGPVAVYQWLKQVAAKIKQEGRPYDHVAIDTLSYLDELSEWVGTWNYMNSPQGKAFNREGGKAGMPMLKRTDPQYESVHDMGEGYGYRWSRQAMVDMFDELKGLGNVCTHFICHVADKYIASKNDKATQVRLLDLSLTGKLRTILARDVDALGYIYQKDGVLQVSFKGNEEKAGGMRGSKHLTGYEGPLDWNKIFLLNSANK